MIGCLYCSVAFHDAPLKFLKHLRDDRVSMLPYIHMQISDEN